MNKCSQCERRVDDAKTRQVETVFGPASMDICGRCRDFDHRCACDDCTDVAASPNSNLCMNHAWSTQCADCNKFTVEELNGGVCIACAERATANRIAAAAQTLSELQLNDRKITARPNVKNWTMIFASRALGAKNNAQRQRSERAAKLGRTL